MMFFFFFNDTATPEIYTLSLHDALPISWSTREGRPRRACMLGFPPLSGCAGDGEIGARRVPGASAAAVRHRLPDARLGHRRSEEHTSELQSRQYLVCRLLLEKKKK